MNNILNYVEKLYQRTTLLEELHKVEQEIHSIAKELHLEAHEDLSIDTVCNTEMR
jgi:hypothetical protein